MQTRSAHEPFLTAGAVMLLVALLVAAGACGGGQTEPPAQTVQPALAQAPAGAPDEPLPPSALESALPEAVQTLLAKRFTGDFDEMVARRLIRVGVTFNRTFYFVDRGVQRGLAYEMGRAFEDQLNIRLKTGNARVHVVFIPLSRDALGQALLDGTVDLVIAQVTIRPELEARVSFSIPTRTNVNEVLITAPGVLPAVSPEDLSGREVFARKGGKYADSLATLNGQLQARGRAPVVIRDIPSNLEDDDVLEMVHAGLVPMTVIDDYMAEFWKKVFTDFTIHESVVLRRGASLAVPVRRNNPKLLAEVNGFLAKFGIGTAFGNMMQKKYLVSTSFARNATSDAERQKFLSLVELFQKYSDRYQLDFLLMAAQAYQESGLNQEARSHVGAVGIMQLMPATGKEMNVGDIRQVEPNIHAGVKYIRFMIDQYFRDEPMDQLNRGLFAFASYNAGPGRVRQLRREAAKRGLDPNVWFGNVEQIASERIGRETVTYVSNIYKYYVAYRLVSEERDRRAAAKAAVTPGK